MKMRSQRRRFIGHSPGQARHIRFEFRTRLIRPEVIAFLQHAALNSTRSLATVLFCAAMRASGAERYTANRENRLCYNAHRGTTCRLSTNSSRWACLCCVLASPQSFSPPVTTSFLARLGSGWRGFPNKASRPISFTSRAHWNFSEASYSFWDCLRGSLACCWLSKWPSQFGKSAYRIREFTTCKPTPFPSCLYCPLSHPSP